ncbi:AfsR/SARP family transcriptional regulator [Paractinoplanes durhamensis]|uniref:AfsR/SARP family transcriptional regulator n=1 Tax=Paractinoplanes durhamensis TaxID=113563 RepID=UPI00362EAE3B
MEIRLLGPIEIIIEGRALDVGAPQQRLVLTALAADAGRLIGTESLIDRVWETAPDGARRTLQVHLSRLRRFLDDAQTDDRAPVQVLRRSGGYLLDIDPDRVDAHRFRRLVEQAHERHRSDLERVKLLAEAMDLWRGPALADLPGQWAGTVRQAWQQQYLDAVQEWTSASIRVGDVSAPLARLAAMTGEYPLIESLAAAYLRALYASGRASDALDHYAVIRQHLAEKLGTDPGPQLQHLYRQILAADPALTADPAPRPPRPTHAGRRTSCPRRHRRSPAGPPSWPTSTGPRTTRTRWSPSSTGWPGSARPPWPSRRRTGSPAATPTGSSTWTCAATPRAPSRSNRPGRSTTCCARWACRSRRSRPAPTAGPASTAPCSPAGRC